VPILLAGHTPRSSYDHGLQQSSQVRSTSRGAEQAAIAQTNGAAPGPRPNRACRSVQCEAASREETSRGRASHQAKRHRPAPVPQSGRLKEGNMSRKVWALILGPDEADYAPETGRSTIVAEKQHAFQEADVVVLLGPDIGEITVLKVFDLPLRKSTPLRQTLGKERLEVTLQPEKEVVQPAAGESGWRRFEYVRGASNKFWEIRLEGSSYTTRWGRIGTEGSITVKGWGSPRQAEAEYDKMIASKKRKGYKEV
jgi:predicted DNA-binding WGR domain protein